MKSANFKILVDIANKASLNHLIKENLAKNLGLNLKHQRYSGSLPASGGGGSQIDLNTKFGEENYACNRQFCSFCLKTQYEANFLECCKDKSWICPFCQGVCFCTRCLRQDTMTQLKAYFIALGGDLGSLLSNSNSVFDKMILANFNTHLSLTLLSNPSLTEKYPNYRRFMQDFMRSAGLPSLEDQEAMVGGAAGSKDSRLEALLRARDFMRQLIEKEEQETL